LVMQQFIIWLMERGRYKLRDENPMCSIVFDMTGFGLSNMDYGLVKYLLEIFRDYYPETLGVCLILNSPWIFRGCWALIKPWLDPKTAKKILFVNSQSLLEDYLDIDYVPTYLGGNAEVEEYTIENVEDGSFEQLLWNFN